MNNYIKTLNVLEDGKLSCFTFENEEIYIQPPVVVDTLDNIEVLRIRGIKETVLNCDTTIQEIENISFSGSFLDLETTIRETIQHANSTYFGGSSAYFESKNTFYISSISDLPTPVGNVITLEAENTYIFVNHVDLQGSRLVLSLNTVILGYSSENCSITSTGLGAGVALITSTNTNPIRHITFKDVDTCLDVDASGTGAYDWTGVNFLNVPNIGTMKNFANFIYSKGAFLNSKNLFLDGTFDTAGFDNSAFIGDGAAGDLIKVLPTAIVNRRFRIVFSAVVAFGSTGGINVDNSASIPNEKFILENVDFSGGSTYLPDVDETFDESLFISCGGITNTSVFGQVYMKDNPTTTLIPVVDTFYKVSGTTTDGISNSKVITSDNKITIDASVDRTYRMDCVLSFDSNSGNQCSFGFYDSSIGGIRLASITKATANAGGRAENVSFFCVAKRSQLDFFEVHCSNLTSSNDITVTDMSFAVTEVK